MAPKTIIIKLYGLLRPFWRWMLAAILLSFITIGASIALMGTSAWLISRAALRPSVAEISIAVVGVRFFGVTRGVFRYFERLISHEVTFRLLRNLRVWFYTHIEPLAPARLQRERSGDLLARVISDIETLEAFYIRVLAPPVVAVMVLVMMLVFVANFALMLVPVMLLAALAVGVGMPYAAWHLSRARSRDLISERAALNVTLLDSLQGMPDILAYGQGDRFKDQAQRHNTALIAHQQYMGVVDAFFAALGATLVSLTVVIMLALAISRVEPIYLATIALAVTASFEAFLPLSAAFQHMSGNLAAGRRLFELAEAEPSVTEPDKPITDILSTSLIFDDVRFRYGSDEPWVLNGLDLCVDQGAHIALVGGSGAGKTSILSLLLRFWDATEGRIMLSNYPLQAYSAATVREAIAVVSQDTHLFNNTIRENLLLARPKATQDEIIQAAQRAHIHNFITGLPDGYETWIGEQGLGLSGGERQRLALARAFLKDAPILVLDEATSNLDTINERQIMSAVRDFMQDRTTLVITHRLTGLEYMDAIHVLHDGRIIESGTHAELIAQEGTYARMLRLQATPTLEEIFDAADSPPITPSETVQSL
ncbi:MAG: thiol reductant ABC exporter subunit CydC [Anaerolineales bacterium]